MKQIFLFSCFIFQLFLLHAQINRQGIPFMRQYTDAEYGDAGQIWAIEQDSRGVMYFGTNYGLMQYNGNEWKLFDIERSTSVFSLAKSKQDVIFYGAVGDFGYIDYQSDGKKIVVSLLDRLNNVEIEFGNVWKTHVLGNKVYFQSFEQIFEYDFSTGTTETADEKSKLSTYLPESKKFHLSYTVNGKLYVLDLGHGLKVLNNNKFELIKQGEFFADMRIYAMLPYDSNRLLIGTRSGFYLYDERKQEPITPFEIKSGEALMSAYLYNGIELSDGKYAFGTLSGGTFVMDKFGIITEIYSENSGLAEGSALAVFFNKSQSNLWIGTQTNGIYKLNIKSGFREWNEHNGLNFTATDIETFNGETFFAGTSGIYKTGTNPETNFSEVTGLIPAPAWDLSKYQTPEGQILLAGTQIGLYVIQNDLSFDKLLDGYFKSIYTLPSDSSKIVFGFNSGFGIGQFNPSTKKIDILFQTDTLVRNEIVSIGEDPTNGALWLGASATGYYLIKDIAKPDKILHVDSTQGIPLTGEFFGVYSDNKELLLYNGGGIFTFNYTTNKAERYKPFSKLFEHSNLGVYRISPTEKNYWLGLFSTDRTLSTWEGLVKITEKSPGVFTKDSLFAQILPQKVPFAITQNAYKLWIANSKGVYLFDTNSLGADTSRFLTLISKVFTAKDSVIFDGDFFEEFEGTNTAVQTQPNRLIPMLSYRHNALTFMFSALFFDNETRTVYSYRLIGDDNEEWSNWSALTSVRFTNLREGNYEFQVKARNIYNVESSVSSYRFSIFPPWYRTWWAYLIFGITAVVLVILIIKRYTRKLRKEKEHLEYLVDERTQEIQMKNVALQQSKEEIEAQRDEIEQQRDRVSEQLEKIAELHHSIMDSIRYASRIQTALLPPDEFLNTYLSSHFVLFRPRDVVSGDFYWATQKNNTVWMVAADCTGHGVPGAFMSMLGMSFLNEIVIQKNITASHEILNHMRESVKRSLRQTGKDKEAKDGMDLALTKIDFDTMTAEYSGAYNPLYQYRDADVIRHKADRMPIGIYIKEAESFTQNIIEIKKGDRLYMFSDGYVDQFGGPKNLKLGSGKFKDLIVESAQMTMSEQKKHLNDYIEFWINHPDRNGKLQEQVDDILVIGIEI